MAKKKDKTNQSTKCRWHTKYTRRNYRTMFNHLQYKRKTHDRMVFCHSTRKSEKDEIKASLRSVCQRIDRIAMPEREEDLIIRYLSSCKGPTTDLQWKETFEDIGSWSEDTFGHLT